jgi:hypothetical protein
MTPVIQAQLAIVENQLDISAKPRILLCLPESAGDIFLSTSLLPSLKEAYPNHDLYYACNRQFFDILENNPYIYKTIEYSKIMMHQVLMEGTGDWPGLFDVSIQIAASTQIHTNYLNNGKTNILLPLKRENNAPN